MTNDDDGSFRLSRRKALASIGTIGAATAAGGFATYAQFTDTEDATVSFTAGGIDGTLGYCATHNTKELAETPNTVAQSESQTNGVGINLELADVKPGDYGSVSFALEVENNAAWVASCLGISEDSDNKSFEPEEEIEGSNYETGPAYEDGPGYSQNENRDYYGSPGQGELAENFLLIPFYSNELCNTFFDNGWPNEDYGPQQEDKNGDGMHEFSAISVQESDLSTDAVATSAGFWNSREGENDWFDLQPKTIREAVSDPGSTGTVYWNEGGGSDTVEPPEGTVVDDGCVFLDGAAATGSVENDDREASSLDPGDDTLHFGYDWHIPFGVGNEVQGDKLSIDFGFTFSQTRHTEAPTLANVYSPGTTPADGA